MGKQFQVTFEGQVAATPQQVWDAITTSTGTAGWIWPMEYEALLGGAESGLTDSDIEGTVTAWDPPSHFATRAEGPDGWFNNLDNVLVPTDGGTHLRYTHTGVFDESEWDVQYDACRQHTEFYMHTLGQYVEHFPGQAATYTGIDGPPEAAAPDAFTRLRRALGLGEDVAAGDRVHLTPDGLDPIDGIVDYVHPNFIGIRTSDAFYRLFGRNAFGWPVGVTLHEFASKPGSADKWRRFVETLYGA
jgi:uncharacterized protein YndB with AHSA1/START domain